MITYLCCRQNTLFTQFRVVYRLQNIFLIRVMNFSPCIPTEELRTKKIEFDIGPWWTAIAELSDKLLRLSIKYFFIPQKLDTLWYIFSGYLALNLRSRFEHKQHRIALDSTVGTMVTAATMRTMTATSAIPGKFRGLHGGVVRVVGITTVSVCQWHVKAFSQLTSYVPRVLP